MKPIGRPVAFLRGLTISWSSYSMDDVPDGLPNRVVGEIGAEGTQSLVLPYACL